MLKKTKQNSPDREYAISGPMFAWTFFIIFIGITHPGSFFITLWDTV